MTSKEIIEREIVKLTTSIQLALGCVPAMNINIELCQQKLSELKQIKQDLDKLEKLEKERQEIETKLSSNETNTFDEIATMIKKANGYDVLVNKCKQFEKALEKSCEMLDYTCPVEEELIDDLDCENCKDIY